MRVRKQARSFSRLASMPLWAPRSLSMILLLVSFVLFFATAYNPATFQGARNHVTDLFAPLLATVNYPINKAADYVRAVTGIAQIQAENRQLHLENSRLREWQQMAVQLQTENMALQDLLHVKINPSYGFVTARIIADSGNTYVKSLLVLAGTDDGVQKGQAVMAANGLIGRVIETGKTTSRILLLNDVNSRIPVMVAKNGWRAILAGQNESLPLLTHLPTGVTLQNGMTVVTSGHGGMFPVGLPVGTIQIEENGEPHLRTFSTPQNVTYVKIIDKTIDENLRQGRLP